MNESRETHDPVAESLAAVVTELEQALEAEAAALAAADPVGLLDTVDRKRNALARVDAALRAWPADRALSAEVKGAFERCRRLNETAGGVIATQKRRNEASLELLGFSVQPEAYGPAGTYGTVRAGGANGPAPHAAQLGATMPFWTA